MCNKIRNGENFCFNLVYQEATLSFAGYNLITLVRKQYAFLVD